MSIPLIRGFCNFDFFLTLEGNFEPRNDDLPDKY